MTSPLLSKISKTFLSILLFSLICTVSPVRAQDTSEEESKALDDIKAATDPVKKIELSTKFLQAYPKVDDYQKNVLYYYHTALKDLHETKSWNSIISLCDKFLAVVPNDEDTFGYLTAAYEATGNTKGFATFGEKRYASKPSAQLATAIAYAYLKLDNEAKFVQWGEKVLASDPDNAVIAGELTGKLLKSQDFPQATKFARICLKALPTAKKPESMDAKAWKTSTDNYYFLSYYALGAAAFNNNQFAQAIPNIDNAVKYNKRFDTAYYCLGMSYWRTNKLQAAMLNFAKAVVLKGSVAASSKQYLEKIWQSSHQGKLTGIDTVYQAAQQDLK
jgi:tetratricopeptide (TPR) repeat protein